MYDLQEVRLVYCININWNMFGGQRALPPPHVMSNTDHLCSLSSHWEGRSAKPKQDNKVNKAIIICMNS